MLIRLMKWCGEVLLVVVLCVLLCEITIRVWGYSDIYMYDPIYQPFPQSDQLNYIIQPNLKDVRGPGKITFSTNEIGLRSLESGEKVPPKSPGEFRIAVLGDSVTFGQGVPTQDTFSEVLEKTMNAAGAGKVRSYNYGEMAYSIKEMVATLEYRALAIQPDLVLLCVIYDDFNLKRRCRLDKWGYLSGEFKDTWLTNSVLKKWLRQIHLIYFLRNLTSEQTTHHDPLIKNFPGAFKDDLTQFDQLTTHHSIRGLVVLLPDSHPYNETGLGILAEFLKKENIECLNLTHLRGEFSLKDFVCLPNDPHPSAMVHRRIGKEIADYLTSYPSGKTTR